MNNAISTKEEFCKIFEISEPEINQALENKYTTITIKRKNKKRVLNIPNDTLRLIQKHIASILEEKIEKPNFLMAGIKGKGIKPHALRHAKQKTLQTIDIKDYYPSTLESCIRAGFEKYLNIKGEALDMLMDLILTDDRILPMGAPTSPIVSIYAHLDVFKEINKLLTDKGLVFSIYYDDMAISTNGNIPNGLLDEIASILSKNGLEINKNKYRIFGYKEKYICGIRINQNGKLEVAFKYGEKIKEILENKKVKDLDDFKLNKLAGHIAFIRSIEPRKYIPLKKEIIAELSKRAKENNKRKQLKGENEC